MLRQFLVGGGVSLVNITIHALVMTTVVKVARVAGAKKISHPSLFLIAVMIPTVSLLMITLADHGEALKLHRDVVCGSFATDAFCTRHGMKNVVPRV